LYRDFQHFSDKPFGSTALKKWRGFEKMARILIVDDDYEIREMCRALLNVAGHDVIPTDGAMNALQILRTQSFELLITDANMPNVHGLDFIKLARREGHLEHTSVIMLTGRRDRKNVEAAVGAGVADYIVKPLDPKLFIDKVSNTIEKRSSEDHDNFEMLTMRVSSRGTALVALHVLALTELGVVIRSAHGFQAGAFTAVDCELFHEIGLGSVKMRVFLSEPRNGMFETRLSFVELNEQQRSMLGSFIRSRVPRTKRKTAA
jgi:two-component system chemotaxis response regulator CheY